MTWLTPVVRWPVLPAAEPTTCRTQGVPGARHGAETGVKKGVVYGRPCGVIAGGGPAGLMLADALALAGVDVAIVPRTLSRLCNHTELHR
jgi:NADPH-dependent 2,4-dienoyl-CoA reductase/sulfur reductase-like enzyme